MAKIKVTNTNKTPVADQLSNDEITELKASPAYEGSEVQLAETADNNPELVQGIADSINDGNIEQIPEAWGMVDTTSDQELVELTDAELVELTQPDAPIVYDSPSPVDVVASTPATPVRKTVDLVLPFKSESPAYIGFDMDGQERWLLKTSLISYSVNKDEGIVNVEIPRALAMKRKLLAA